LFSKIRFAAWKSSAKTYVLAEYRVSAVVAVLKLKESTVVAASCPMRRMKGLSRGIVSRPV
jgi:hypothetical protein